jgi:hypothetical protein
MDGGEAGILEKHPIISAAVEFSSAGRHLASGGVYAGLIMDDAGRLS